MSIADSIKRLLADPPPEFVFEIDPDGIAMSRTRPPAAVQYASTAEGLEAAVRKLVPTASARNRRTCALLLPDSEIRIAIVDFETLPAKDEERRALIRFRMRRTLPFDVDSAALSYHLISPTRVVVAVAPAETIAHYEAPFRAAGLNPGFVTAASLALLELIPAAGSLLVAHRTARTLTVMAVRNGALNLIRTLELTAPGDPLDEVSEDLYPTLVYIEDQTGSRPEKLLLCGFDANEAERLAIELEIGTDRIGSEHPALEGYIQSVAPALQPARNQGGQKAA